MGCDCFTCANKDPVAVKSYLTGQFEAFEYCIKALEDLGYERGNISEALSNKVQTDKQTQLNNLLAVFYCNKEDCGCLIESAEFDHVMFKGEAARFNKQDNPQQLEFNF